VEQLAGTVYKAARWYLELVLVLPSVLRRDGLNKYTLRVIWLFVQFPFTKRI